MKKILIIFISFMTALSPLISFNTSHALQIDNWAKQSYNNLSDNNIIPEILIDTDLRQRISRLEFTHLLITYLLSNKNYQVSKPEKGYTDVDDSFVNLAQSLEIVTGYTDGSFKPYSYITRSEAAVIAHKVELLLGTAKEEASVSEFKDYKYIPTWAVKSIGSMVSQGIMSGYPNKNFSPSKNITRQEAIVMVDRLLNNKSYKLLDAFNISKNDEYLSKLQYDFILSNIPMSKYTIESVKQKIFLTSSDKRINIYKAYNKSVPFSNNTILTSADLIFDDGLSSYIIGIEIRNTLSGKKEQRAFMIELQYKDYKINSISKREYSSWYTVSN